MLMRRLLEVGAALCAWSGLTPPAASAQGAVPIFALLSSPPDTGAVLGTARRLGLAVVEVAIPGDPALTAMVRFTVDGARFSDRLLDSLRAVRKSPALRRDAADTLAVRFADLDVTSPPPAVEDGALAPRSWGQDSIRAPRAWSLGVTGAGVKVGIIDTGYELGHPELAGRVVGCRTFTQGNLAGTEGCAQPLAACNWHGQHVAGTVAGSTAGVAPDALLVLAMNYENVSGQCRNWTSARIAALNWLIGQGVKAINVSTGAGSGAGSELFAVRQAHAAGITVCGASGNDGGTQSLFPGGYDQALSIGAIASNLTRASYSNRDTLRLDFALPGSGIVSAIGASSYGSKSGTSMATPHCTGLVGLLRQVLPTVPADSIWALMRAAAKDLGTPGHDGSYGWGLVRADRAVALALGLSLQPLSSAGEIPLTGPFPMAGCAPVDSPVEWTVTPPPAWLELSREADCLRWRGAADPGPTRATVTLSGVP